MVKSGASKGAKKIKPFDDMDTRLAMGVIKVPSVSPVEQIKSGKALEEKIRLERYEKKLKRLEGRQKGLA
tara:strand:+ start:559 stop:768 length:210 start_codon:yes stop_codon:yes gene_type:complete